MVENESRGWEGLSLFIALRWMQEPSRGDDVADWKYPSLLEDFLAGTASMARKRNLASSARGFCCFCLMAQIEVQKVQEVQWVQIRPIRPIRPIRLIRGRKRIQRTGFCGFCLMASRAQDINPPHPWQNNYPLNVFQFLFCQVFSFYTIQQIWAFSGK